MAQSQRSEIARCSPPSLEVQFPGRRLPRGSTRRAATRRPAFESSLGEWLRHPDLRWPSPKGPKSLGAAPPHSRCSSQDVDSREVRLGARRPADPHSKVPWGNGSVTRIFGDATLLEDGGAPTTTPWPKFSRPGTCGSVVWVGCATPDSSFWRHPTGGTSGGTLHCGGDLRGNFAGSRHVVEPPSPLCWGRCNTRSRPFDGGNLRGNFALRRGPPGELCR